MLIELSKLASASGDPGLLAKLMVAAVPIGGVLGATFASMWSTGRTTYVNTIVAERTKALGELRDQLAEFFTTLSVVALERRMLDEAAKKAGKEEARVTIDKVIAPFEKLEGLENQICLRLNPDRQVDKILMLLMAECGIKMLDDLKLVAKMNRLICLHSQWLVKEEWASIKWEAGGISYKFFRWRDAGRRRRAYRTFLNGEGEVAVSITMALIKHHTRAQGLDWGTDEDYEKIEQRLKPRPKPNWWQRTVSEARRRDIKRRLTGTTAPTESSRP